LRIFWRPTDWRRFLLAPEDFGTMALSIAKTTDWPEISPISAALKKIQKSDQSASTIQKSDQSASTIYLAVFHNSIFLLSSTHPFVIQNTNR
jgi:hypothetical protein